MSGEVKNSLLLPRASRFIPNASHRQEGVKRNSYYRREHFNSLEDWFFYTHIDPVQRLIHAIGMVLGLLFFCLCFYSVISSPGILTFLYYILGAFFYYVSGIISHQFYDNGTGRSHPKYLLATFIPVIKINLATSFGYYDRELREFIKKYPFVKEAYDLVEIPKDKVSLFLRGIYIP